MTRESLFVANATSVHFWGTALNRKTIVVNCIFGPVFFLTSSVRSITRTTSKGKRALKFLLLTVMLRSAFDGHTHSSSPTPVKPQSRQEILFQAVVSFFHLLTLILFCSLFLSASICGHRNHRNKPTLLLLLFFRRPRLLAVRKRKLSLLRLQTKHQLKVIVNARSSA